MKRFLSLFLRSVLRAGLLTGCGSSPAPRPTPTARPKPTHIANLRRPIEWKDENFKNMVYNAMAWGPNKQATPYDLRGVRSVTILPDGTMRIEDYMQLDTLPDTSGKYIYEGERWTERNKLCLDDIVNFPELSSLTVILAEVENLDFLSGIRKLKNVTFQGCAIEDLSPFAAVEKLERLSLKDNNIADISPLANMKNLTWLELSHNNISDISPLKDMEVLPQDIVLSFNNIKDISALRPDGRGEELAYLNLRNNKISDISPLEGYKNIGILSLTNNYISDWSYIAHLPATTTVYTGGNPVADRPQQSRAPDNRPRATTPPVSQPRQRFPVVISDLPIQWQDENLKKLVYNALGKDLSETVCPQDLSGITQVIIIAGQELYFGEKTLSSGITGVADKNGNFKGKNKTYTSADMAQMNLDDLHYFTNLTSVRIALVDSGDIEFTRHLPNLRQVFMNGCNISDISPLTRHNELLGANLSYNNISDLSPLSQVFIHSIYLDHNNISDLSVFGGMSKLPHEMNFAYNNISDITPLARGSRQEALAHLSLRDNNISDISPLKDYVNISILSLTNNNITDVSPLKNLNKGNNIYLVNNPVENYDRLSVFYNLSK